MNKLKVLDGNECWTNAFSERFDERVCVGIAYPFCIHEGKKFKPSKDRICAGSMGGTYDGKELTRTCLRPGAYDYMDCPSLMAGYTRPFRGALV